MSTEPAAAHPAALGRKGAVKEIGDQIEALIAFMDDLGGDPDLEEDSEDAEHCGREPDDDAADLAWVEWHTRGRRKLAHGAELIGRDRAGWALHEDDEDDDPREPRWVGNFAQGVIDGTFVANDL